LDEHFPGVSRPSLLELEMRADLGLHMGHPVLADGARPVAPNFHFIGMMNCKKVEPLPKDLAKVTHYIDTYNRQLV
jgi:hypothetical protein